MSITALTMSMTIALGVSGVDAALPNPDVPCWLGEGSNEDGFVDWDTRKGQRPYLITHDRDQFRDNGQLEQDYNFINYWLGNPATPIMARHYLGSDEVSIFLPEMDQRQLNLAKAKASIPDGVLCYLQTRFAKVDVLTSSGYETVWTLGDSHD